MSATGGGGSILLGAVGDILVDGPLRAAGIGIPAFGGSVVDRRPAGRSVSTTWTRAAGRRPSPLGGTRASVEVTAGGRVDLSGTVDVSHGECLTCEIEVTRGRRPRARRSWIAQATGPPGTAAPSLLAGASIVLDGDLVASGGGGDPDFGGGGGDVMVVADDALDVNASILLGGTAPDGDGGTFDLVGGRRSPDRRCRGARRGRRRRGLRRLSRVPHGGSRPHHGSDQARRRIVWRRLARRRRRPRPDGGGRASRRAPPRTGPAGDVALEAARTVRIDADVDAGGSVAGSGGSVLVEGCDVTVAARRRDPGDRARTGATRCSRTGC